MTKNDSVAPVLKRVVLLYLWFSSLQTYQWSDKVIKTFVRPNWFVKAGYLKREVQMIVTPNVIKEVREYFNCSELEGAELEDQGEEGTALTHWEKRVFEVTKVFIARCSVFGFSFYFFYI